MAIERERRRSLKQALLVEITHRVKNGLAIVAGMLKLQASEVNDAALTPHLEEAAHRVSAVAKAHERIHQSNKISSFALHRGSGCVFLAHFRGS
jgi:two-component sensor histidine kinase